MKVKSLELNNFKRFGYGRLDFTDPETGLARDLVVLLGPNGCGKSTVLQAIACTLGTATERLDFPNQLAWPGLDLELAATAWPTPYRVVTEVEFTTDEIAATNEYYGLADRQSLSVPDKPSAVQLVLAANTLRPQDHGAIPLFLGRRFAGQVLKLLEEGHDAYRRVGTVFWYTDRRDITSLTPTRDHKRNEITFDEALLRRRLSDLAQFHDRIERGSYSLRPGQRDLFADLQRAYEAVFPGRRLDGPVPRSDIDEVLQEPWFYLFDGKNQYEIQEMSGGEKAVFPILFDFANWRINRSVVLIDELELHLHPPMQQAFLRALESLGEGNQFIITTHSDSIEAIVPEESIIRMGN